MKKITALLAAGMLVLAPMSASFVSPAKAANISNVTVNLTNSEAVSAVSGTVITFTPVTALTTGSVIEISYDTAFTDPGLTDGDITVSGTNISSSVESDFSAGYFRSTVTTSAPVSGQVTITIGDEVGSLVNPSTGGNYNFTVTTNVGGTIDSGSGLAYVANENDVLITAVVVPVIDMELYQTGSDSLLANPNTCSLGVLSINNVNECTYDVGFGTNSPSGMTIMMTRDANEMNSGANTIDAVGDGAVTAGQEEYGFQITDAGTGCSATASGTYGSQDNAVPGSATEVISTAATCNGTTSGQAAKRAEFTYRASVDAQTAVGSYDELNTFTAFSK